MAESNVLAEMVRKNPQLMGTGLLGMAQSKAQIQNEYKKHVMEAAQKGEAPMELEDFIKLFQAG